MVLKTMTKQNKVTKMVDLDVANGADNNVQATDIVLLLTEYQLRPLDSLYFYNVRPSVFSIILLLSLYLYSS